MCVCRSIKHDQSKVVNLTNANSTKLKAQNHYNSDKKSENREHSNKITK
jgi:hypothetical protein